MTDAARSAPVTSPAGLSPRWLAAAPHRLMFFAGATNVLLAMAWWAAWLVGMRWPGTLTQDYPPIYPGWLHSFVMQYQMLPAFFFGFLLTTFPRWMKLPDVARWRYLPVGVALIAGQLTTLAGALGSQTVIEIGVALTIVGWAAALSVLVPMLWREQGTTWHARSCVAALTLGFAGLLVFAAFVFRLAPATWVPVAIKLGTFGLLLPVYVTVAHRMFPFFASNVVEGYQAWRPLWLLAAFWIAVVVRLVLDLSGIAAWTWLPDIVLFALMAFAWWRWWPRGSKPGILTVLFVGLTWLPIAMALYTIDGLAFLARDAHLLGRAPAHALFVGFFGSVMVAMDTRVTQGHSGRPIAMPPIAWFTFVALQLVAIVRIAGELTSDPYAWFAIAAVGWLVAFLPWVIRLAGIYLAPRVDRKPG